MRRRLLLRAAQDCSGVALVEFAVLLPGLLSMFLGSYEGASLILADMKLEAAAETAADLIAQAKVNTVLQSADFTNMTNAISQVMTPYSTSGTSLKIAFASITYNTGSAAISWHYEANGASAISVGSLPNGAVAGNLGSQTNGSTDSVIVVQLTYSYTSPISYAFNSTYTLSEAAMNRPRYMNCIPTYLNTNSACP